VVGFKIKRKDGRRCNSGGRLCLYIYRGWGKVNFGSGPCCVDVYRWNENTDVMNDAAAIMTIRVVEVNNIPMVSMISARRLIVGGAARFVARIINHHRVRVGEEVRYPLLMNNLREFDISYIFLAMRNMADEEKAWAIMVVNDALRLQFDMEDILAVMNLMWATDEYAIIAFMSFCRRHNSLVNITPINPTLMRVCLIVGVNGIFVMMRSRPNPPNFSKIAARIIDPASGAST
jgi:hypothetical protein